MIQEQFFRVFQLFAPEVKHFYQKHTLEEYANLLQIVAGSCNSSRHQRFMREKFFKTEISESIFPERMR